jgi:polysaccharide biosynthesis protein PelF
VAHPHPHPAHFRTRIPFVFAWLSGGTEEAELCRLARALDPARYRIRMLPCQRAEGSEEALEAAGVEVDTTACTFSFDETVAYLTRRVAEADIVVSCQNVADIYPVLDLLHHRPPLIERGRTVAEAMAGPKHFTTRYIAASEPVRAAAASRMRERRHAATIPPLLDTRPPDPTARAAVRAGWEVREDEIVIGWSGPCEGQRAVEAALGSLSGLRFVHLGGMPLTDLPSERHSPS